MTGVVTLFHVAIVGGDDPLRSPCRRSRWRSPSVLAVVGLEGQRRHDRLFVDLL